MRPTSRPEVTLLMSEDRERIARLEENQSSTNSLLAEMREDIKQLRNDWTKARGLVAGAVLAISAIWGMVLGVWQFVKHKFG